MKQKSHSGLKKRVHVKKSGTVMVQKAGKKHLLSNKSKRQKKSFPGGLHVDSGRMQSLRRLLPGIVKLKKVVVKTPEKTETK